jgi:radical SAM protein with 4Fe4S-binding SPASM domain
VNATEDHFYLSENNVFVRGATNSLLLSLSDGGAKKPNETARKIIELGERGLSISEVIRELNPDLDSSDILSFINQLQFQGIINFSATQRSMVKEPSNPELEFLWIEMTSACNLRCIHCYADANSNKDNGLPKDILEKIIDDASNIGCKAVQFTGGECTLRDDLPDLIKYARLKGFNFVEIFTNGNQLTESMIRFLAKEKVHVAMSIYSFRAKTHDSITGVAGSFEKTINSLKLLLLYGVPTRCETIAMKQNEDDLEATNLFLSKLGVQNRSPDPIRPCGRGLSKENWPEDYGLCTIQTQPRFLINREIYDRNKRGNSCWFGKASVSSSGDVMPCIFARDQIVGNVLEQRFGDIILGTNMQSLWELNHDRIEVCKDCEYRYVCWDCRPWAYGLTGNIFAKYPKCTYDPYSGAWGNAEEALRLWTT